MHKQPNDHMSNHAHSTPSVSSFPCLQPHQSVLNPPRRPHLIPARTPHLKSRPIQPPRRARTPLIYVRHIRLHTRDRYPFRPIARQPMPLFQQRRVIHRSHRFRRRTLRKLRVAHTPPFPRRIRCLRVLSWCTRSVLRRRSAIVYRARFKCTRFDEADRQRKREKRGKAFVVSGVFYHRLYHYRRPGFRELFISRIPNIGIGSTPIGVTLQFCPLVAVYGGFLRNVPGRTSETASKRGCVKSFMNPI